MFASTNDPNAQVVKLRGEGRREGGVRGRGQDLTRPNSAATHGYHAQMEPLNAVVRINDAGDKVEVWEGKPIARQESRKAVAKALGLKNEQVDFHQCYMGGGFGRRGAARLCRRVRADRQGGAAGRSS